MASRTVQLKLTVRYEYEDRAVAPSEEACRVPLAALVAHAANRCLLSGETDLVVED